MAVDSNAVTLAQYALMSNDPRVTGFTNSLLDNGSVMARDIPFVTNPSLVVRGSRWEGSLPTVDWTALNTEGAVTSGTPSRWSEQAYILRNRIQIDKFLMRDNNQIDDPMAVQVSGYARAVAYDFNFQFIEGDPVTDGHTIVGLRHRLDNVATYGLRSANKLDAAATMTTAASAANVNAFFEKLDELLWSVQSPDGNDVVLYMNDAMQRRLAFAARIYAGQGGLGQATDQIGRSVMTYKNARIQDIGYKADQSTRIIKSTETSAGADGASTYTSIYAVHYGRGEWVYGWQFAPLFVSAPFLTEGGAVYQVNIDWAGGVATGSNWAVARLYGINLG